MDTNRWMTASAISLSILLTGTDPLVAAPITYSAAVLADQPIGYWRLGEMAGPAALDTSSNNLNGTYQGGITLDQTGALPGDRDTSAQLDGSTGFVTIGPFPALNQLTNDVTFEMWLNPDHISGRAHILSTRALIGDAGGYGLWRSDGHIGLSPWGIIGGGGSTTNNILVAGVWQHVVVTFDSNNAHSFYLNGEFIETATGAGPINPNNNPLHIGRSVEAWGSVEYWDGGIDDVAIYDRTLAAQEIEEHYLAGITIPVAPNGVVSLDGAGDSHMENFNAALGGDGGAVGGSLPPGWVIIDDGSELLTITKPFPPPVVTPGSYNAGSGDDRTLATGTTDSTLQNQLQLWAESTGTTDVRAVRLEFAVEAWAGNLNAPSPGEAAYVVDLEIDRSGDGDFGRLWAFNDGAKISTGSTLVPGLLDGNSDANRTMFDSGLVELPEAIPAGSTIRLSFDAQNVGQTEGYLFGLDDVMFRIVAPGDTDGNGEVDSDDLFDILGAGKFNHPELGPASWGEGDFTGDDLVNSDDLFAILSAAQFNAGPYTTATPPAALATVPEPSSFILATLALVTLLAFASRRMSPTPAHRI